LVAGLVVVAALLPPQCVQFSFQQKNWKKKKRKIGSFQIGRSLQPARPADIDEASTGRWAAMGRLSVVANNVKVGAALQMKMNAFRFEHISDYRLRGVIDVDSAEHKKRLEDITRSNAVRKPILSM
jgi:hypothetical protein